MTRSQRTAAPPTAPPPSGSTTSGLFPEGFDGSPKSTRALKADLGALLPALPRPHHERLAIADLTPYPAYGREVRQSWLSRLRKQWSPAAIGVFSISRRRDGTLVVVDANHRHTIAREKGDPLEVDCEVWDGLTDKQESLLYRALNQMLNPSAGDLFRSELGYGDRLAEYILLGITNANFTTGLDPRIPGGVRCIRSMQGLAVNYGLNHLFRTLNFVRTAFDGDARGATDYAMAGIAAMLIQYPRMNEERMLTTAHDLGWLNLKRLMLAERAEKGRKDAMPWPMHVAYVRVLITEYNRDYRKKMWQFDGMVKDAAGVDRQSPDTRTLRGMSQAHKRQAVWNDQIDEAAGRPS